MRNWLQKSIQSQNLCPQSHTCLCPTTPHSLSNSVLNHILVYALQHHTVSQSLSSITYLSMPYNTTQSLKLCLQSHTCLWPTTPHSLSNSVFNHILVYALQHHTVSQTQSSITYLSMPYNTTQSLKLCLQSHTCLWPTTPHSLSNSVFNHILVYALQHHTVSQTQSSITYLSMAYNTTQSLKLCLQSHTCLCPTTPHSLSKSVLNHILVYALQHHTVSQTLSSITYLSMAYNTTQSLKLCLQSHTCLCPTTPHSLSNSVHCVVL